MVVHDDMGSPRQHRAAPGRHAVMHEAISTGGARHMQPLGLGPDLEPVSSRCLTGAWRIFSHTAVAKFRARSAVLAIIWPIVPAETRTPNRSARICPSRSSGRNCRRRDRSPRPPAGCHIAPVPGPRAERRPWSSSRNVDIGSDTADAPSRSAGRVPEDRTPGGSRQGGPPHPPVPPDSPNTRPADARAYGRPAPIASDACPYAQAGRLTSSALSPEGFPVRRGARHGPSLDGGWLLLELSCPSRRSNSATRAVSKAFCSP